MHVAFLYYELKKYTLERVCIFLSKPQAWHIITARSAVYITNNGRAVVVSHHAQRVSSFGLIPYRLRRIPSNTACWLHPTLRVDSIPQTSCGFHPRLRRFYAIIYIRGDDMKKKIYEFCRVDKMSTRLSVFVASLSRFRASILLCTIKLWGLVFWYGNMLARLPSKSCFRSVIYMEK